MSAGTPGLPTRAMLVFAAPARLFDALREEPRWIGMMLVVVALSLLSALLIPEDVYVQAFLDQAPAEAPAEAVRQQADLFYGLRYAFAALGPPLVVLVIAGFLLFVFNVILGGEASFSPLFSATTHAFLIPALGGLLTVPVINATGDLNSALALHLLVPGLGEGFLLRFLQGLNVFGLWASAVLGIAVARLDPARELRGAAGTVLGFYVGLKAVFALLGGLGA